ncbi:gamma-glutamylcyclotransferase [Roseinatronobacter bogoriensis]|uniref:gamma-glutamylcyclotransferase n=1 Tax=Roseinatronobacter bogoriensis TaxID=119542 RepID=UPI0008F82FFD|nr:MULTISPECIES: gamma-glutamylcyclotransferase [Rhodobaca]MBB4207214.1 cation transport protein ChaC [Rhodobaca bogoriensis DSM 18756]TDW40417.1 cation transport protein ChaC [Rhodobaca barguzinensis]TDY70431.1 cation transport protein ChaC [Rhodobaca bogoriensis DSM 18756]
MDARQSIWVFGYGSLIWEPGFAFASRQIARLEGYQRSFCMRSIHHRGTVARPGLVLALDEGQGGCEGVAFEIPLRIAEESLEYLRARELISAAYLEARTHISLQDGQRVEAVTYVIDRAHEQYCAGLSLEEQAQIIAGAVGGRGPNSEYLFNTAAHLAELGLRDKQLDWLAARVRALGGACFAPDDRVHQK